MTIPRFSTWVSPGRYRRKAAFQPKVIDPADSVVPHETVKVGAGRTAERFTDQPTARRQGGNGAISAQWPARPLDQLKTWLARRITRKPPPGLRVVIGKRCTSCELEERDRSEYDRGMYCA